MLNYKPHTRLKLADGREISVRDVAGAYNQWQTVIAYIDAMERSVSYTPAEYVYMPAKYSQLRLLAGFNAVSYHRQGMVELAKVLFGSK